MISESALWLILFLPLASFVVLSLLIRPFIGSRSQLAGYISILAVGVAFVISLIAMSSTISADGIVDLPEHTWLAVGEFDFVIGILLDPLTAIMLVVVTAVSLLVQIYSIGYMHGDGSYTRYFAYMSLFTASMLGLILANNLIMMFVFWEGVGFEQVVKGLHGFRRQHQPLLDHRPPQEGVLVQFQFEWRRIEEVVEPAADEAEEEKGLLEIERESVGEALHAAGLRACGVRSRADANGDPWSALLTTR